MLSVSVIISHSIQNPAQVTVNPCVHPWHALSPAHPGAEADHSDEIRLRKGAILQKPHQPTPTVSNTGISSRSSPSTDLLGSEDSSSLCVNTLAVLAVSHIHYQVLECTGRQTGLAQSFTVTSFDNLMTAISF